MRLLLRKQDNGRVLNKTAVRQSVGCRPWLAQGISLSNKPLRLKSRFLVRRGGLGITGSHFFSILLGQRLDLNIPVKDRAVGVVCLKSKRPTGQAVVQMGDLLAV